MDQFVRTVTIPLGEYEELKRIAKNRKLEPFKVAANELISGLLRQYRGQFNGNPELTSIVASLERRGYRIRNLDSSTFELVESVINQENKQS